MAPASAKVVADCGYQTPDEQNRPSYFASPTPSPAVTSRRPAFVPHPSYGPVLPPDGEGEAGAGPGPEGPGEEDTNRGNLDARLEKSSSRGKVGIRDRISCHRWTWFTMATGGMANVIHSRQYIRGAVCETSVELTSQIVPYQAAWLNGFAVAFFLLNLVLFIMNCVMATLRFRFRRGELVHSFTDQTESLFIPASVVSFAVICINISMSMMASATIYLILWSTFNLIMAAASQANQQQVVLNKPAIALCAVATQGAGCLIAFMISAAFIYRLMTQKLPRDFQRPGVADKILPNNFGGTDLAAPIVKVVSMMVGLWLWGLSVWFFVVSVGSLWKYVRPEHKMPFQMTWWSFVFPNTALVTATTALGKVFQNTGLQIFGNAAAPKDLPIHERQQSKSTTQPKSSHVADDFLQDFLDPSFDPAAYLNASLPPLQPSGHSSRSNGQAVPLADLSNEAQTLLSQLNVHTTRLSGTLTQLTDDILRSGSRLAYEVELLRGETLSLAETMNDTLQEDIKKFVPGGLDEAAKEPSPKVTDGEERRASVGASKAEDSKAEETLATGAEGETAPVEPPYINQLRTLTVVRSRLDSVIKTFGDAMEFVFPPSELSVSSSFLSVSAPEPGAEQHSTEDKGQQVLQKLRDEISQLLTKSEDPVQGIEKAAQRIEELKDLNQVWKGTAEEKGRTRFIESLAKMVEDRHRDLMREVDQASRRDGNGNEGRARKGSVHADAAENKTYLGGYGLMSQLQKLRSGL
ncbi:C4-dicarboxylate transporter/malic acid transporter [Colletotrichum musicola]|uniref:C4-dicarboxylate transporter/malic acid transporter n=1 Tax=Colletotrichum musicola TaxID=2175873 RepID=A0A8H6NH29_9PEZI|nr:C4-dicarboxylate transporter/malic acid transporter [Colletotrichum musicola]